MKRSVIISWVFYASCMIYAALAISSYINTGSKTDLIFAIIFAAFTVGYALRSIFCILKNEKEKPVDIRFVVILIIWLVLKIFHMTGFVPQYEVPEKDYAAQLNMGRPTTYYCHIESDDFNRLYQELLDNDWSLFLLPTRSIPGSTTVRSASTYGDNITVEYGDKFNTTVRFIQNRKGLKTSDRQFIKLKDGQKATVNPAADIVIDDITITQEITVITSGIENKTERKVYSYSWNKGNCSYFIETICDMEKDFDDMQAMIESMHNINVSESTMIY